MQGVRSALRAAKPGAFLSGCLTLLACSTTTSQRFEKYSFPPDSYVVGKSIERSYQVLAPVKTRVDYETSQKEPGVDLCHNAFNKGAQDLVTLAKRNGADAVIEVSSVVFAADRKASTFPIPECSVEGPHGQILMQGTAVKWSSPDSTKTPPAIPSLAKEWPYLAPSTQMFRSIVLKPDRDKFDGVIRVLSQPPRVVLFAKDKTIQDEKKIEARRLWLTTEALRSRSDRTVILNWEPRSQPAEVDSSLLSFDEGKLERETAIDNVSGNAVEMVLINGPHSGWRLTETLPHDILQVAPTEGSDELRYIRYNYLETEESWVRSAVVEPGRGEAGRPFPSEEKFPPRAK